jgi:Holliday junction resolvase
MAVIVQRASQVGADFENIVAEVFRKAGWRVRRHPAAGEMRADLLVESDSKKYVVEVKSASEGRRDRLIPLLSQAILQAQSFARLFHERVSPLAVVASKNISESVADQIVQFAELHAPEVSVGVVDFEGFRSFSGSGLEALNARKPRRAIRNMSLVHAPDLFSDLNQWMLKILLGQELPETLISIPREPIRNASHLAAAARVSVMSASRLVNHLKSEGFIDENYEDFQIVRAEELLQRWISANREISREIPARWIIRKDVSQFLDGVASYANLSGKADYSGARSRNSRIVKEPPRLCIGVFAAADALGVGFVRGVPPHLYLERLDMDILQKLGLSVEESRSSG